MYFKRLGELRTEHKLSQKEVAEAIGLKQGVYSRYERGEQTISVECLKTLSEFYDVSADYIVGRTDNPQRIVKENGGARGVEKAELFQ